MAQRVDLPLDLWGRDALTLVEPAAPFGGTCPMRIAFVGKGGAGKSSIAGTFARLLGSTGREVLAVDSDPMPGLAFSLGVPSSDEGIPDEAVEAFDGGGRRRWRLRPDLTTREVIERYARHAPDGVLLLQLGKARGPHWDNAPQHAGFQQLLNDLPATGLNVVGDLPGGTRQAFQTWGRYAQVIIVVVEPQPASILTGRRLARLAQADSSPTVVAVANKVRDSSDAARVAVGTGLEVIGCIPLDSALVEADRHGRAVLDRHPKSAYIDAVRSLVTTLLAKENE